MVRCIPIGTWNSLLPFLARGTAAVAAELCKHVANEPKCEQLDGSVSH